MANGPDSALPLVAVGVGLLAVGVMVLRRKPRPRQPYLRRASEAERDAWNTSVTTVQHHLVSTILATSDSGELHRLVSALHQVDHLRQGRHALVVDFETEHLDDA